jgi:hypothetical protein
LPEEHSPHTRVCVIDADASHYRGVAPHNGRRNRARRGSQHSAAAHGWSMSISDVSNSLRLSTKAVLCILQKPQYRTTRHYQPAQDRQVAICDKAMQHRHPLIPLPFAVSTMVTRWSLLNCLFCHSALRFWSPVRRLNHHTAERYEHTSCSRHA